MSGWVKLESAGAEVYSIEKWSRSRWHWRSVAVVLQDRDIVVYSPIRGLGDEAHADLRQLGHPAILCASNGYHYLGLAEYRQHYPECQLICSARAASRLGRKTGLEFASPGSVTKNLPEHVDIVEPEGLKSGELWLRIRGGGAVVWVVSDAFFTLTENPSGVIGWICRLTGTTPGLRIGRTFTGLAVDDRSAYGSWLLAALESDRPTVLVPSHGAILHSTELAGDLAELARKRL